MYPEINLCDIKMTKKLCLLFDFKFFKYDT